MDQTFLIVVALVALALCFDFINGFHDAANSIATVVSTRVLSPGRAVAWAAFFNFVAAFGFGTAVAKTVGSGMIHLGVVTVAWNPAGLVGIGVSPGIAIGPAFVLEKTDYAAHRWELSPRAVPGARRALSTNLAFGGANGACVLLHAGAIG